MSALIHKGSTAILKATVEACRRSGSWRWSDQRRQWRFTSINGEILNWWPDRGTIQLQGKDQIAFRADLERELPKALSKKLGLSISARA